MARPSKEHKRQNVIYNRQDLKYTITYAMAFEVHHSWNSGIAATNSCPRVICTVLGTQFMVAYLQWSSSLSQFNEVTGDVS